MAGDDHPPSEAAAIAATASPITASHVTAALRNVGIEAGQTIIVHSSLSRLGWVVAGPESVVAGLLDAIGPDGTIVMPAQTGISDPSTWENPPVPESWWQTIRDAWPAFDPIVTPLRAMGVVVECFRRLPGIVTSGHPAVGFVGLGPAAAELLAGHTLATSLGDASPLGRLYAADATIVMLGVGHGNNTSLHLAEHRATFDGKHLTTEGAPLLVDGERRWVTYETLAHDDEDFPAIGAAYVAAGGQERRAPLGNGEVIACPIKPIVDFATEWLTENR